MAETTEVVFGERQLRTLRELGESAAAAQTPEQACAKAAATLGENPRDVPFAVFYLLDDAGRTAHLAGSCGLAESGDVAPPTVALDAPSKWPLARVAEQRSVELVRRPARAVRGASRPAPGRRRRTPRSRLPLASPDQPRVYGVMIAALSPHRALDDGYRGFFELAAAQVVTAIRNATAYQEERRRAEALAEIDRAKTEFFSNVSHEFRTPLTLMLGPTRGRACAQAASLSGEALEIVHRNELRLLKLVNNLLDFARIEAGRAQASYQATDLTAMTRDLASGFRSAIERAGLELRVACAPLGEPAFVDRDMWEKIVLNLLSNAFKFTFDGSIAVTLQLRGERVELAVADTGIGHPRARAAAPVRALPPRARRALAHARRVGHRPGAGPRAGAAARRDGVGELARRSGHDVHGVDPARQRAPARRARRRRAGAAVDVDGGRRRTSRRRCAGCPTDERGRRLAVAPC